MARLILDTGVLIEASRGRPLTEMLARTDDLAVPAVTVAEFLLGVLLIPDPDRALRERAFLRDMLGLAPTLDYTARVAEEHAALLVHVRRTGEPRAAHDLIIAATARSSDRTIVTTDGGARFDDLPGVTVRLIETS